MAVSNSTDFARTANELIVDALELLGKKGEEEPLQAYELERGLKWLNYLLKTWQADGVMGWTLTEGSLSLVASTASYAFSSGGAFTAVPVDIQQMRVSHDGGSEIEMTPLSRDDYYRLPVRTSTGHPTQFFYDRQRDSGTLYVWPVPSDGDFDVTFTYRRRIMDMDASTNSFDIPQEWYLAVVSGLAALLIPIYGKSGTPRAQDIRQQAGEAYNSIKGFDIDEGESSMFVLPNDYAGPR